MENSVKAGFMAAFVVSGSVILVAHQIHKHLLSHFMEEFEFELGGMQYSHHAPDRLDRCQKYHSKKKVRFAEDVIEPSWRNKEYRMRQLKRVVTEKFEDSNPTPPNRKLSLQRHQRNTNSFIKQK